MRLSSPDFENNTAIPDRYTCTGYEVNPELLIENIPTGTQSMALTVIDRDSTFGTWVHWVVYDISMRSHIPEDSVPGIQGLNSFGKTDYGGPCPQAGTHRYFFTMYALDTFLALQEGKTIQELETAMAGHVLAKAELVGLYRKPPVPLNYKEITI